MSRMWKQPSSPSKKFEAILLSVRKIMATVYRDHKGVFIVNFLDHDNSVTALCYCGTLEILWWPHIAHGLCCCTKVYFTHQQDL
jgi:Transposase.